MNYGTYKLLKSPHQRRYSMEMWTSIEHGTGIVVGAARRKLNIISYNLRDSASGFVVRLFHDWQYNSTDIIHLPIG